MMSGAAAEQQRQIERQKLRENNYSKGSGEEDLKRKVPEKALVNNPVNAADGGKEITGQVYRHPDPRFDFFSEHFDPLAALYNFSLEPPRNVRPFGNLAEYEAKFLAQAKKAQEAKGGKKDQKDPPPRASPKASTSPSPGIQKKVTDAKIVASEVVPESSPRPQGGKDEKDEKDEKEEAEEKEEGEIDENETTTPAAGLTQEEKQKDKEKDKKRAKRKKTGPALATEKPIETIAERNSSGPMSLVKRCFVNHTRVKVWIRNAVGLRGTCVGFIIAFDKHLNLVLMDVEENFKRLKSKAPREFESVARHLPQLFVKGDSVIMVSPLAT